MNEENEKLSIWKNLINLKVLLGAAHFAIYKIVNNNEKIERKLRSMTATNITVEDLGTILNISMTTPPYRPRPIRFDASGEIRIPLYVIIFLLSVIGNVLVILTLIQNRRMRTVTNVFLLNLSISDLLLAVFCMPFTLIPSLLRNFMFGEVMCVLIRYLQGTLL